MPLFPRSRPPFPLHISFVYAPRYVVVSSHFLVAGEDVAPSGLFLGEADLTRHVFLTSCVYSSSGKREFMDALVDKHKTTYKASTTNPEFLFVLSKVVAALQQTMHNDKLPDLSSAEMSEWFRSIEPEHIACVVNAEKEGTVEHNLLMKSWSKIADRSPCDEDSPKSRPSPDSTAQSDV